MPTLQIHRLSRARPWRRRVRHRLWREWTFLKAVYRHLRWRILLLAAILLSGAALFVHLEPEKRHSFTEALFYTWSLVFGQPPESFPRSWVLQALFFLVPILGLTVIIEAIIDLSHVFRGRQHYEKGWCLMMASSLSGHIVLVGLGRLGIRSFRLLRQLDEAVVVIEVDPENPFLDEVRRDGMPLLVGDGRRDTILEQANVARARSIILATNDDLANMEMALDARRMSPGIRVVLRMFDQALADKIRGGFNIHLAMSQSAISAPAFAMAALDRSIVNSFVVGNQLVIMQRWQVSDGSPLVGLSVGRILAEFGFSVVERQDAVGASRLFPPPDALLQVGDALLVQGPFEGLKEVRRRGVMGAGGT